MEHGGIAVRHTTFLPLPQVVQEQRGDVDSSDHSKDHNSNMTKLPVSQASLDKDINVMDIDAIAAALDQKELEEKEAAQVLLNEAALLPNSVNGSGRTTPAQLDEGEGDGPFTPGSGKKGSRKSKIGGGRASIHTKTVTGAGNAWGQSPNQGAIATSSPAGKERVRRQTFL